MEYLPVYVCVLVLSGLLMRKWLGKTALKLPPGPSAVPILGSVHHLTLEFQHKTFWKWSKTYGAFSNN